MTHRYTVFAVAILWTLAPVIACEIRVRDSAFRTSRDLHKLCVIADSSDPSASEIESTLTRWLDDFGEDLNLEVILVHADDPATNWRNLGLPSAPPQLPVTVLVGRDNGSGTNFLIDFWEPSPTSDELDAIATSPVRSELATLLATHLAVLIYAPGPEANQSARKDEIRSMVQQGIADERIGLSMVVLDRHDPEERLLCKFMGLRTDGPDTICVAFGRGKLMSPPLVGDEITAANVDQLITQIRQACSCSKPLPTMGVDAPLVWSATIDSSVILMDEELDMTTLADEVETMLAAKASTTGDQLTLVPIPSGVASELPPTRTIATDPKSTIEPSAGRSGANRNAVPEVHVGGITRIVFIALMLAVTCFAAMIIHRFVVVKSRR